MQNLMCRNFITVKCQLWKMHEYYGHGINNWSQKDTHWKCYNAQMNHPTFSKLPKDQQYEIKTRKYHYYINRNR